MLFWLIGLFFIFANQVTALEKTGAVSVRASVGDNRVTITGFASPESRVELSNSKTYSLTYSDNTGYFIFNNIILPKRTSDLCLTATDDNGRHTNPVCVPPPPDTNYHTEIGPVLLPPTISISDIDIKPGSTVFSSGQGIPNTTVNVYFYKINDNGPIFPAPAYAYSLPIFTSKTDQSGNFSLNLPTAYASNYRLFASVQFQNNLSPKSNTLIYFMPSLLYLFFINNQGIFISFLLLGISLLCYISLLLIHPSPNSYQKHPGGDYN